MPLLDFSQPMPGVFQTAYVVKNVREPIPEWATNLKVGPWFVNKHFLGEDPIYRGRESKADVTTAHSFAGHMNIEVIQPNDTNPSVYKEVLDGQEYGFISGAWPHWISPR